MRYIEGDIAEIVREQREKRKTMHVIFALEIKSVEVKGDKKQMIK